MKLLIENIHIIFQAENKKENDMLLDLYKQMDGQGLCQKHNINYSRDPGTKMLSLHLPTIEQPKMDQADRPSKLRRPAEAMSGTAGEAIGSFKAGVEDIVMHHFGVPAMDMMQLTWGCSRNPGITISVAVGKER